MNPQYDEWFDIESERIRVHRLRIIKEKQGLRETILSEMDTVVLGHYNDLDRLQRWADRLNLSTTAAALQSCLPTLIRAQSGHIGEILLTEIIPELFPDFIAPIKRLRWLDGRNMALRGEDYIGVDTTRTEPRFLKAESKSRANLITNVVTKARSALLENDGNPTTHAMLWVASRLEELNQSELADIFVDNSQGRIQHRNLIHLVFTFSGNDSSAIHRANLGAADDLIEKHGIGLIITDHRNFIETIYQRLNNAVIAGRATPAH